MKLPLGWLAEWIDLPLEGEGALDAFVERLTVGGLEIEEILQTGPDLSALVVGHVDQRSAHPDADRLSVCRVDVGAEEPVEIVCGAPNVDAGQRVAVALHGAVLPDGHKIKRSKIRGVRSNGMICSARELGLGDEHDGILVLETEAAPGTALSHVIRAGETVLDLEITPNRGDWVSMLGMAREVRAHYGGALRIPETKPNEAGPAADEQVSIEIDDATGCRHYVARVIRGVEIGASPGWLVTRLEAAGLRSVNNVVDVTNLVMLEFGQPLHAFDLAQVRGGRVVVRSGDRGETFTTLDGQERELSPEDVVIADGEGAIAIGGVMGGMDSEVTDATSDLLLESAWFEPTRIRRTAKRLGLRTDASYRFERGVDPEGVQRAADRAARLIAELAGGEVAPGVAQSRGEAFPDPAEIEVPVERVNGLLGTGLSAEEMTGILERLDFRASHADETLRCTPPAYRRDVAIAEDVIEEIGRIHGFDAIEPTLPPARLEGTTEPATHALEDRVRDALAFAGLTELMTFPGLAPAELDALRLPEDDVRRDVVRLVNPIQAEAPVLRTTLVPSMLRAGQLNLSRQAKALRLFEVGRVFLAGAAEDGLPTEDRQAVALLSEARDGDLWAPRDVPAFFQAKGVAERLLAALGRPVVFRAGGSEPYLHPGACGAFEVGRETVAQVGELHPEVAAHYEIEPTCALVVVDLDALLRCPTPSLHYREIGRHPGVRRDLAVLLESGVATGDVIESIRKKAGAALNSVRVFDRYEGKGVPEGKVSVAFRLLFQRVDRTLTDAEVNKAVDRIVKEIADHFGGELR